MNEAPIIVELRNKNTILEKEYQGIVQKYELVKEESPDQLSLFVGTVKEDPAPISEIGDHWLSEEKKNHLDRGKLSKHLPVEEILCEFSGVLSDWERLSDVITETLDYRPACLIKEKPLKGVV